MALEQQKMALEERKMMLNIELERDKQPEEAYGDPVNVKELGNTTDDHCGAATLCVAETNPVVTTEGDTYGVDGEMASWPSFQEPLSNSALLKNLSQHYDNLSNQQQSDLVCLFNQYPSVTSDSPGFCTYLFHETVGDPEIAGTPTLCTRRRSTSRWIAEAVTTGQANPDNQGSRCDKFWGLTGTTC
ncbi:hypothetical protein Pcinc_002631 [Petrolisthes cinctipes]|uniref:Uncharacterized protein n=1 Tax=Petrolisthes cinctipes TaxID=88211 RepID=A0AAE1GKK1_PETCI|nr:hypothetical protein Pcinc_008888 [Petrolisthes cinctipes]KAK3893566.1 hypothetical protein Pcinc_002631 [Petrolisthes cinctipes]